MAVHLCKLSISRLLSNIYIRVNERYSCYVKEQWHVILFMAMSKLYVELKYEKVQEGSSRGNLGAHLLARQSVVVVNL